jgi:hypothetical protein
MKHPTQTVKHMQVSYRKYQLFAFVCALLTLGVVMLAAVSGVRISALRKSQNMQASGYSSAQTAQVEEQLAQARSALDHATRQWNAAKEQVTVLTRKIADLEKRLAEKSKAGSEASKPPSSVTSQTRPDSAPIPAAIADKAPVQPSISAPLQPVPETVAANSVSTQPTEEQASHQARTVEPEIRPLAAEEIIPAPDKQGNPPSAGISESRESDPVTDPATGKD